MKKFIAVLLIIFSLLISCGPSRHIQHTDENAYGYTQMYYDMNKTISTTQIDSMIVVDNLATLDKWFTNVNGDKSNKIVQYFYIKSLDTNNELIYVLTQTQVDTLFKCTKRITTELK